MSPNVKPARPDTKLKRVQPIHRRRSSDEMYATKAHLEQLRNEIHTNQDDEHVEIVADVIGELLQLRVILNTFLLHCNDAKVEATTAIEKLTL
jgi:hypothetical protein